MKSRTTICAEAGANFNKSLGTAYKLIDAAVAAKADIVKFQTYSSETLYCKNTPDFGIYKNINKLIKDIELPREWQKLLKSYCNDSGIEFLSTPFDEQAVDELYALGVKRFKIGGVEATDPRFVKYVAQTKLPLIISAGIGTDINVVQSILFWIEDENPNADITILHCNNAYPTPFEDINLLEIKNLKEWQWVYDYTKVDLHFGFSDHTLGILAPPIAVTLGAEYIEKHFTLDKTLPGPDHAFAIEPTELKQMVNNIRVTELMLRYRQHSLSASEKKFKNAMRSVVSKRKLFAGEKLTTENITTKRPQLDNSLPAMTYFYVLGKTMNCDLDEDCILTKDMISG